MVDNKTLFAPIKMAILFSVFTIILYEYGVWNFPTHHKFIFYLLLISIHIMMFSGYWFGLKVKMSKVNSEKKNGIVLLKKIINIFFIINLITILPAFMIYTGEFNLNLSNIFSKMLTGINSPSENYMEKSVQLPNSLWILINYFIVITGFIRWCLIPLGLVYWSYLKPWQKCFLPLFILVELLKWLVMGTNKGLFDLFVIVSISILINIKYSKMEKSSKVNNEKIYLKKKNKKKKWVYLLIGILFVMVISFFTENLVGRQGGETSYSTKLTGNYMVVDKESVFIKYTPEFLHNTVINLTTYLTHGYYALSLGIDLPFEPTFGIGGSWFLIKNFEGLTSQNIFNHTYLYKIESLYGWSSTKNWHTVYIWIANDFSFFGIPFIIFIFSYVFARSWKDFIYNNNPFSLLMVFLFITFFQYISANNQVFSEYTTLFAVWFIFIMWLLTKNAYYWREDLIEDK